MPKKLHDKLASEANKKGLTGKAKQAYIYGTMNKSAPKSRNKKK